jgi:two-component system cell cycle sensor histidine kinase/response regulator CckA
MNLCVNARDAMPDGGTITLSAENVSFDETYVRMHLEARPIRYVVLKVEDTGMGMAPGVLERIFDPFFTTKDIGKGTGLGLSTSRSIVKSHGGFINVYSEPGKGSSFCVYIPSASQSAGVDAENVDEGVPMGEGELILVVDDEAAVREIAKEILVSYGYKVIVAGDGTEALTRFVAQRSEIRAVITDMMMPFMDGAATIRALKRLDPAVKVVVTSGLLATGQSKEALDLRVDAILSKPYTADMLLRTIRTVLTLPARAPLSRP